MKRFIVLLTTTVALSVVVASTAIAANKPRPQVIITKNCPVAKTQQTYKGNVIVYVSGSGCVSVDSGATAIASGNAVVVAHGSSTVDARDHVVLVTYNRRVKCQTHGTGVTVINSSGYKPRYTGCPMAK